MIRNSRRMVALAVAGAVAIAPVISGCGAGFDAESAAITQVTEGVNESLPRDSADPQILLRNMFVLAPNPGAAATAGMSLPLYGTLINQQEEQDRLISVSSPQFASATIEGDGVALPAADPDGEGGVAGLHIEASPSPGQTTPPEQQNGAATPEPNATPTAENTLDPQPAQPAPGETGTQPAVVLTGLNEELHAGAPITVRLQFEKAGAVEFPVPLVPRQDEYATYPPAPGTEQGNGEQQPSPGTEPNQPEATQSPNGGQNGQPPNGEQSPENGQTPDGGQSPGAAGH